MLVRSLDGFFFYESTVLRVQHHEVNQTYSKVFVYAQQQMLGGKRGRGEVVAW